jgi:hypothetical protein
MGTPRTEQTRTTSPGWGLHQAVSTLETPLRDIHVRAASSMNNPWGVSDLDRNT